MSNVWIDVEGVGGRARLGQPATLPRMRECCLPLLGTARSVLAALGWLLLPSAAAACSCILLAADPATPLVEQRIELPANAIGIPVEVLPDARPADQATVLRRQPDGGSQTELVVRAVRSPLHRRRIHILGPKGGLEAGSAYELAYRWDMAGWNRLFRVEHRRLEGGATQIAQSEGRGLLRLETREGGCSTRVRAVWADLELELPSSWLPYRRGVLFETTVDGQAWTPSTDLCSGRWTWPGFDRVYAVCEDPAAYHWEWSTPNRRYVQRPSLELDEGLHEVRMTAWLPGTEVMLSASTTVELRCPELWPGDGSASERAAPDPGDSVD